MTYHDIDIPLRKHQSTPYRALRTNYPPAAFIAIDWTGMTLALIPIILRFSLRRRQLQPQPFTRNLSDGLVLLSWLSGIVLISINTWKNSLRQRYTHHRPASDLYYGVPHDLSAHLLYVSWISLFFIYIALWAAKFALLAFYASLLRLQGRWSRIVLAAATLFTAGTFALHIALLARWCSPTSSNWNVDGHLCSAVHDIRSVTVSTAANVATDLVILALPLCALALLRRSNDALLSLSSGSVGGVTGKMGMGKAEWSGLAFVLCMAALSITAALARFVTLQLVQRVPKANITHTIDVWALVEIVASLLAVCLPSCRAFVRRSREGSKRASREMAVREDGVVEVRSEGVVVMGLSVLEAGEGRGEGKGKEEEARRQDSGCLSVDGGTAVVAHASSERLL